MFGGCNGNGNNFRSLDDCSQTCGQVDQVQGRSIQNAAPAPDRCTIGPETGPCRGHFVRFFHNGESGQCEEFVYGGCNGNGNNFKSAEECQAACSSAVQPGSRSRSTTANETAACSQPKKVGPCRAAHPRFFFNRETGVCEVFAFGGCEANANNFRSEAECVATCAPTHPSAPGQEEQQEDVCNQEVEVGPCYGDFARYFHNKRTGQCEEFTYGGCHGNGNNFRSEDECEAVCGNKIDQLVLEDLDQEQEQEQEKPAEETKTVKRDPKVICSLPADDGGCRAFFPMFYFDPASRSCQEFVYGGCLGNGNRFPSMEECRQFCAPLM